MVRWECFALVHSAGGAGTLDGVPDRDVIVAFYRRYNSVCNAHDFDRLGEFVADGIRVNGEPQTLARYAAGLRQVVQAFPDYRWNLSHLLVDGNWVAAHFLDTGTHRGTAFGVRPPAGQSAPRSSRSTGSRPRSSSKSGSRRTTWTSSPNCRTEFGANAPADAPTRTAADPVVPLRGRRGCLMFGLVRSSLRGAGAVLEVLEDRRS
jgi:predicted ester cyclase